MSSSEVSCKKIDKPVKIKMPPSEASCKKVNKPPKYKRRINFYDWIYSTPIHTVIYCVIIVSLFTLNIGYHFLQHIYIKCEAEYAPEEHIFNIGKETCSTVKYVERCYQPSCNYVCDNRYVFQFVRLKYSNGDLFILGFSIVVFTSCTIYEIFLWCD